MFQQCFVVRLPLTLNEYSTNVWARFTSRLPNTVGVPPPPPLPLPLPVRDEAEDVADDAEVVETPMSVSVAYSFIASRGASLGGSVAGCIIRSDPSLGVTICLVCFLRPITARFHNAAKICAPNGATAKHNQRRGNKNEE